VKQHAFAITVALFCLAAFASATDAKQSAQAVPQSQTQITGESGAPTDQPSSVKSDCSGKPKHSKRKHQQSNNLEPDSQVPPNQVEYGGGG